MTLITPEQRKAVEDAGETPPQILDPQTNTAYVLLREDVYQHLRSLDVEEGTTPAETAPLIGEVMKGDWDDPAMDAYDEYPGE